MGPTDRDESVATVREAVESGITLIDVAPSYGSGEAELVVGQAFDGRLPDGVRVCTKSHVGDVPVSDVHAGLERSLDESLERMVISFVALFVLHSPIVATIEEGDSWRTPLALYREAIRPAMGRLVEQGRIGAWGITAAHPPSVVEAVLARRAEGERESRRARSVARRRVGPGRRADGAVANRRLVLRLVTRTVPRSVLGHVAY